MIYMDGHSPGECSDYCSYMRVSFLYSYRNIPQKTKVLKQRNQYSKVKTFRDPNNPLPQNDALVLLLKQTT